MADDILSAPHFSGHLACEPVPLDEQDVADVTNAAELVAQARRGAIGKAYDAAAYDALAAAQHAEAEVRVRIAEKHGFRNPRAVVYVDGVPAMMAPRKQEVG